MLSSFSWSWWFRLRSITVSDSLSDQLKIERYRFFTKRSHLRLDVIYYVSTKRLAYGIGGFDSAQPPCHYSKPFFKSARWPDFFSNLFNYRICRCIFSVVKLVLSLSKGGVENTCSFLTYYLLGWTRVTLYISIHYCTIWKRLIDSSEVI